MINSTQAKDLLADILKVGLVPMLAGSPGIGKSDIVHSVAKHFNLKVIDHRLSTSDPCDLSGFPAIVEGRASYTPFDLFPVEGQEVPAGYDGWLLFLDEWNSAPMSVQAASYKLALDRMVGQHRLHEKVAVVGAGNLQTDGAIVNRLSTAMQSRLVHLELAVDPKVWIKWAYENDVDHRVTSWINYNTDELHQFDPNHQDKTFRCPRTWHFLSRLIKQWPESIPSEKLPAMEGTIGASAREFYAYCELSDSLPKIEDIINNPSKTDVPGRPDILFLLCGSLASRVDVKSLTPIVEYLERMPIEFQIVAFRDMLKRKNELKKEKALRNWIMKNSAELFD